MWYFCIQCQSFFHLWRVTAGHKYLYFFSFFTCFIFSLSGCESFLPCSSLILLDKKTCVWTYCNNKCCFLDVNCIVGEGLNLSATNFTSVCVCDKRKKKRKKKDDKIRDGRGALPNRPISTCHLQFFNQTWLSTCLLFLYLKKKKRRRRDGMSRGVLPFDSQTLWAEGLFHPHIISTHYNIPSHGSVWTTTMQDLISHIIPIIVLWMFSTFSCGWKSASKSV